MTSEETVQNKIKKILMLCVGNYCRSPLAHELLAKLASESGMGDEIEVDSAGLGNWHVGDLPHTVIQTMALEQHGLEMRHRGRELVEEDAERFDVIFCMDTEILEEAKKRVPKKHHDKLKLFRYLDKKKNKGYPDIKDPYYTNDFSGTYQIVLRNCELVLRDILNG